MDDKTPLEVRVRELGEAIRNNTHRIGMTNREIRDQIKEASLVAVQMNRSINELTDALNLASEESTKLGKRMVILTFVLVIAAIASIIWR